MKYLLLFSALLLAAPTSADGIDDKVAAALAADTRPEADRVRDKNRMPLETLNFFGLEDDMRVLELLPGGGWYTRVLAPVLAENGKLYVAINTRRVSENVMADPGFDKIEVIDANDNLRREEGARFYTVDELTFGQKNLDMVLTFRNMHNFTPEARERINRQVFRSLKSGGVYGVVDHTRRHMEPFNPENGRRVDPVLIIKELLDVGFEFDGFTDLHYRADDELEYEVGRRSVSGNTDRFTLKFRKP